MRVAVVGATGSLGREVTRQMLMTGHEVIAITRTPAKAADLEASGLRYTILRPTAFMETHAHELLGKAILNGKPAVIFGRGEQPANFVAARDVAAVAVMALSRPTSTNEVIEIGGPTNLSRHEVAALYARLSGRSPKLRHVSLGTLRIMSALLGPFHPGISEVMRASIVFDTTDQTFDPAQMLRRYPIQLTHLDDFVRDRITETTPR